jgi:hypothetical protein
VTDAPKKKKNAVSEARELADALPDVSKLAASFESTRKLAEQMRAATKVDDSVLRAVNRMNGLANLSDAAAKMAQFTWPKGVTETLLQNLRPRSAMTEVMKLDMDRFSAAAKLAKEMQSPALNASLARLSGFGVESGLAAELRRLQESMPVFRVDPQLDRMARDFAASFAPYQSQFQALSKAIEEATAALKPHAEIFRRAAEEERVAEFILELGFVPHDELWDYIADIDRPEGVQLAGFAEGLASEVWAELEKRLALGVDECMGDGKLHAVYVQMLKAHGAGLHEMTLNSLPTVLERAVGLARGPGEKQRTFEWIKTELSELPISWIGGYRGYRVWKILIDHTFAGCWTDAEADATKYPNRHASAHGIGTRMSGMIDSLNAILLTHFVIRMASAVRHFRDSDAA